MLPSAYYNRCFYSQVLKICSHLSALLWRCYHSKSWPNEFTLSCSHGLKFRLLIGSCRNSAGHFTKHLNNGSKTRCNDKEEHWRPARSHHWCRTVMCSQSYFPECIMLVYDFYIVLRIVLCAGVEPWPAAVTHFNTVVEPAVVIDSCRNCWDQVPFQDRQDARRSLKAVPSLCQRFPLDFKSINFKNHTVIKLCFTKYCYRVSWEKYEWEIYIVLVQAKESWTKWGLRCKTCRFIRCAISPSGPQGGANATRFSGVCRQCSMVTADAIFQNKGSIYLCVCAT